MKQRITSNDLSRLTPAQRTNLRRLWMPMEREIAMAYVCVNVETDEYTEIEFCIGSVLIRPSGTVMLVDLRATDGYARIAEGDDGYDEPVTFSKDDCLPLLSIGEMIEIMDSVNFRNFHFYLLAGTGVTGCEVGQFRSTIKEKILTQGYQNQELCDVLWQMIVAQL